MGLSLWLFSIASAAESPDLGVDGFFSENPAQTWQEGLITGNGTMGVLVHSATLPIKRLYHK